MKRLYILLALCLVSTLFMAACDATASTADTPSNQVHMNDTDFIQKSITINKGERITLTSDTFTAHTIANGTWKNGTPDTARESGAPAIEQVSVAGNSSTTIGPFTSAGTFELYCTIHQGMNLTIIVR